MLKEIEDNESIRQPERQITNLKFLANCWGPIKAFGDDENDEFKIIRENGRTQGIFKSWAIPVIPFVETDQLPLLSSAISRVRGGNERVEENSTSFWDHLEQMGSMEKEIIGVIKTWKNEMLENPLRFAQQVEKAVTQSRQVDRRLIKIFKEEALPKDPKQKIQILTNRLVVSLGLLSPFYNVEALVSDPSESDLNPVIEAQRRLPDFLPAGEFDLIAQALPSALGKAVIAREGDWGGIDWGVIFKTTDSILKGNSEEKAIILKLARKLGINPEEIVFAANALQWIPVRVGGKRNDFSKEDAIVLVNKALESKQVTLPEEQILDSAGEINSMIRFFNWLPAKICPENFTGQQWTYASVCDTSAELREVLIQHPEVWQEGFSQVFKEVILPQVASLDAESAKGRLFLSLLLSGKLKKEFQPMLDNVELELILEKLFLMRKGEWIHILGTGLKSESILGGKGFGLEFLLQADREHDFSIPCGIEITSEAITDLLYENTALRQLIVALDQEKNPDTKLAFACQIRRMIKTLTLDKMVTGKIKRFCQKTGQTSFAVRSSSADEDNFEKIGNTNAGIHETILDVNEDEVEKAILECLQSFFGEKAIRMRHLIKASNMPSFAILIQPMIKGVSGIAFSRDLHSVQEGCIVEVGKNAGDVTDSGSNVTHISFDGAMWNVLWGDPGIITHENLDKIKATLEKIEQLRGEDIDLEWVIDQQGKLWVLQSRALPPQKNKSVLSAEKPQGSVFIISKDTDISVLETCIASEQIPVTLRIEGFDLGSFQGCLFSLITKQSRKISQVITDRPFPRTGHFANICGCLGINILSIPG